MADRLVHMPDQLLLPCAVIKRKSKCMNALLALLMPFISKIRPLFILIHKIPEPITDFYPCIGFMEILNLFRIHVAIGHTDTNLPQVLFFRHNKCITESLHQMDFLWLPDMLQFLISPLDLVHDHLSVFPMDHAIRTSLDLNLIVLIWYDITKRHLRFILQPHALLDHPVDPAAVLHGIRRSRMSVINIALPENKFHKIPHGNLYIHVGTSFLFSLSVFSVCIFCLYLYLYLLSAVICICYLCFLYLLPVFPVYFLCCRTPLSGFTYRAFLIVSHCMGGVKSRMQVMDGSLPIFIHLCCFYRFWMNLNLPFWDKFIHLHQLS